MSTEPSPKSPRALEPLTGLRIFFAAVGILIMLFSGGCSLFLLFADGNLDIEGFLIILFVGGPPFLVGYVICRVAISAGRRRIQ